MSSPTARTVQSRNATYSTYLPAYLPACPQYLHCTYYLFAFRSSLILMLMGFKLQAD
jgi:hypothetical protein